MHTHTHKTKFQQTNSFRTLSHFFDSPPHTHSHARCTLHNEELEGLPPFTHLSGFFTCNYPNSIQRMTHSSARLSDILAAPPGLPHVMPPRSTTRRILNQKYQVESQVSFKESQVSSENQGKGKKPHNCRWFVSSKMGLGISVEPPAVWV